MRRETVTISRSRIKTALAPAAIGPYSQAIHAGDTLYCSGQIAIDPRTGHMVTEQLEMETEQVLENLGAVLRASGMEYRHVVRCTVYLADINDYAQVNEIYSRYFSEDAPARVAIQAAALPRGARVEISCIAVR
jgi:2-iminobutanoate/2-iminopropanoate deaminase